MDPLKSGITPDMPNMPDSVLGKPVKKWADRFGAHVVVLARFPAAIATAAILAGCTTTAPATSWCDLNTPFRPSVETFAVMNDDEVTEALSHNAYGQRACGWRP